MGKHTPGPWTVDDKGAVTGGTNGLTSVAETYLCKWYASQARAREQAKLHGVSSDLETCADMVEESRANGNLIAAAPDLLEACKAAVGAYEALALCGASQHLPGYSSCLTDLHAAIAKAEGQP